MKTEELLNDLTPDPASADSLVAAARAFARRRRAMKDGATALVILAAGAAGIAQLSFPQKTNTAVSPQPPSGKTVARINADELLDSFGDQPVALVTYPDGSQRLLAVVRPGR